MNENKIMLTDEQMANFTAKGYLKYREGCFLISFLSCLGVLLFRPFFILTFHLNFFLDLNL